MARGGCRPPPTRTPEDTMSIPKKSTSNNAVPTKAAIYGDPDKKPAVLSPSARFIPAEMREADRWVLWRLVWVPDKKGGGKWSKVPYRPNGRKASSTNPKTWSPFSDVADAYGRDEYDGIGF